MLAKLVNKVKESLKMEFDIKNLYFWTDSSIVLAWLACEPNTWKVFVANRISNIQSLTDVSCWRHVSSADNPADVVSRGCDPDYLLNCKLWWSGPHWLQYNAEQWPKSMVENTKEVAEERQTNHLVNVSTYNTEDEFDDIFFGILQDASKTTRSLVVTLLSFKTA